MLAVLLLPGCASVPDSINPVSWWHALEGGPIAAERAPAPGAEAPYPNLANVPPTPAFLAAPERVRISAALLADRTHAQQQASLAPLPSATPGSSEPAALASAPPVPAPASSPGIASASLPAAGKSAPPAVVQTVPPPPATLAEAAAALPSVPVAPPPPPAIAALPLPGPPPVPFVVGTSSTLSLRFAAGSARLSAADRARIGTVAARRGNSSIAVIGYGDAAASDPAAQSAALRLGLARAAAVATALAAAGVPDGALRLEAEASGNGAALRLVD